MIKLTRDEAVRIQADQVDHYAAQYGDWIRAAVAEVTYAWLLPDGEIDVVEVNRRIPRGGAIESLICSHIGHQRGHADNPRCVRCNGKL